MFYIFIIRSSSLLKDFIYSTKLTIEPLIQKAFSMYLITKKHLIYQGFPQSNQVSFYQFNYSFLTNSDFSFIGPKPSILQSML